MQDIKIKKVKIRGIIEGFFYYKKEFSFLMFRSHSWRSLATYAMTIWFYYRFAVLFTFRRYLLPLHIRRNVAYYYVIVKFCATKSEWNVLREASPWLLLSILDRPSLNDFSRANSFRAKHPNIHSSLEDTVISVFI